MRDLFHIYRGNLSADYDSNKSLSIPHNTEHTKWNDIYPKNIKSSVIIVKNLLY